MNENPNRDAAIDLLWEMMCRVDEVLGEKPSDVFERATQEAWSPNAAELTAKIDAESVGPTPWMLTIHLDPRDVKRAALVRERAAQVREANTPTMTAQVKGPMRWSLLPGEKERHTWADGTHALRLPRALAEHYFGVGTEVESVSLLLLATLETDGRLRARVEVMPGPLVKATTVAICFGSNVVRTFQIEPVPEGDYRAATSPLSEPMTESEFGLTAANNPLTLTTVLRSPTANLLCAVSL